MWSMLKIQYISIPAAKHRFNNEIKISFEWEIDNGDIKTKNLIWAKFLFADLPGHKHVYKDEYDEGVEVPRPPVQGKQLERE